MKTYVFTLFIQILLYFPVNCNYDKNWIDPFKIESEDIGDVSDVNKLSEKVPPRDVKIWTDPYKLEPGEIGDVSDISKVKGTSDVMAYYKRSINLILSSVLIEHSDTNNYKGRLFIDISSEDYMFLRKFADGSIEERLSLQKVDQILANILTQSATDQLSNIFMTWTDYICFYTFNRTTGVYITVLMILIVIYKLLKVNFTPYQILIYLVVLMYLGDFIFTWKRMLQELEINKYADSLKYVEMPMDCNLSQMSAWQFFLSFMSETNCRTYHKVILYDVFWDVGPLDVIAHQSRVMVHIASNIGIAISKLVTGLMSDLPFPLNILLLPILLIFTLFLIWSVLTYMIDTHIDLNLFHFIQIKFKTNQSIKHRSEESKKRLRNEIEELELSETSTDKRKKERRKKKDRLDSNSAEYSSFVQDEVVENESTSEESEERHQDKHELERKELSSKKRREKQKNEAESSLIVPDVMKNISLS